MMLDVLHRSLERDFIEAVNQFLKQDNYISTRKKKQFLETHQRIIITLKYGVYYAEEYQSIKDILLHFDEYIALHNEKYIKNKLEYYKDYFDHLFDDIDPNIKLDEEQRIAILTEEDYAMIIAGAGSGKTTTMAGKVKFLVEQLHIDPSRIMLISYTNKAVDELKERINKQFKIPSKICTFHKFGMDVIRDNRDTSVQIMMNPYPIIRNYFEEHLLNNKEMLKQFMHFFVYYFDIPSSALQFPNFDSYIKYRMRNDFETLKSRVEAVSKKRMDDRKDHRVSARGEMLRSSEEVMIANYLYLHNIEYEYEKPYPYRHGNHIYLPDFTIYDGEKVYYLEHFGINSKGKNTYYNPLQNRHYKANMVAKQKLHLHFHTELISTFSQYDDHRSLLEHLEEELQKRGIGIGKRDIKEVYQMLINTSKDMYYQRFILFLCDFIAGFKQRGFEENDMKRMIEETKEDRRTSLFLKFAYDVYLYYQEYLKMHHMIDFDDMIMDAYHLLNQLEKHSVTLDYDYIIIDEYQDISMQRFNLTKRVSDLSQAKVIAVGDDWQAIFAFAGSDVTLFTQFKELMGYGKELQITNTYRNSQELIDIAGKFVMANQFQIQKRLKSHKHLEKPVTIVEYTNEGKVREEKANAIDACIKDIINHYGVEGNILLIGRYHFDKYHLINTDLFYETDENHIVAVNHPNVNISFLTAHSSKGLGYDNVIIINGEEGTYGFPSQLKDDPILDLIRIKDNSYINAEERRLFYVALTRTKNRVYIVSSKEKASSFIKELKKYKGVLVYTSKKCGNGIPKCPRCHMPLVLIKNQNGISHIYRCSNEKELCSFRTNHLTYMKNITLCPSCHSGELIVKYSSKNKSHFIGCTKYQSNHKGCNYVEKL